MRNLLLVAFLLSLAHCAEDAGECPHATDVTRWVSCNPEDVTDAVHGPDHSDQTTRSTELVETELPRAVVPCHDNIDCPTGRCLWHLGEQLCAQPCIAGACPPGYACTDGARPLGGTAGICVSLHPTLCLPCNNETDCETEDGLDGRCVQYGPDTGSFCASPCSPASPCPIDFSCQMAVTRQGQVHALCLPFAGHCDCPPLAVELQMQTECTVKNEFGHCSGVLTCTVDGLSACDALAPALESCDGVDNDCDGQTDEDICDDGNLCSEDTCDPEQGCVHVPLDGTKCLDFDECTEDETCVEGTCIGLPVDCNDDQPCTFDTCLPDSGCHHFLQPDGTVCLPQQNGQCLDGICTTEDR